MGTFPPLTHCAVVMMVRLLTVLCLAASLAAPAAAEGSASLEGDYIVVETIDLDFDGSGSGEVLGYYFVER